MIGGASRVMDVILVSKRAAADEPRDCCALQCLVLRQPKPCPRAEDGEEREHLVAPALRWTRDRVRSMASAAAAARPTAGDASC